MTYITLTESSGAATPNILDNAGFDIWQRGTSLSLGAGGQLTADRWNYPGITGGAATFSKETTIVHNSPASGKFVITNVGSATSTYVFQTVENYLDYAGQTVTFSAWINTTLTNVRVALQNGTVFSAFHPGDGQWHQLSVTTTLASNITFLNAFPFIIPTGLTTGTVYVDSAMLTLGSTMVSFIATNPQVDLARCQRYFVELGHLGSDGNARQLGNGQIGVTNTQGSVCIRLPVQMRATPTVTFTNVSGFLVNDGSGNTVPNTLVAGEIDVLSLRIDVSFPALTAFRPLDFYCNSATSLFSVSADL